MSDDDYNQSAFDMIVALRGGLPGNCDFCRQPFTADRYPVPEEAGEWACSECVARWDAAERNGAAEPPAAEREP